MPTMDTEKTIRTTVHAKLRGAQQHNDWKHEIGGKEERVHSGSPPAYCLASVPPPSDHRRGGPV